MAVVSIGVSEKAQALLKHLDIQNGNEWLFCDPDNIVYEALDMNNSVASTFFSPETPYAFRDRIFGLNGRKDGLQDLFNVLSKWKDAAYVPPKQEQAFQQGGAFIFRGIDTVYAHYDASAGAHIPVDDLVRLALEAKEK